ncbi:MAG: aldehyde dehydrogenase family protein [Roseibium sp.]|uniref:aldehyde dehydrogenase family protein n=1 Tax=Roseibium sp. TaxID=1936156 RepID=UPI002635A92D|nr:aldehyde dehydrogenase family protein [Roseibium sp.]MCV0424650.1 aldehyde dehydrogenase family protein [Roseibium sp.]
MTDVPGYWQNFIDGSFCDGGSGRLAVLDPATGEPFAEQALADAKDVDRAVAAAKALSDSGTWSGLRPVERGRIVRKMGDYILERIDEIAPILTREAGKPLWEARLEIEGAARYFEYYGNQAETVEGRSIPLGQSYFDFTTHEPFGVSAQIIPWNYPMEMTARSLSAALAVGCSVVVKTPELDPLTNRFFADAALACDLPKGALNLLCGLGKDAGAALAAHPDVNQIVFTGSVATGISIASAAARNVVPCILELGGKSAAIVHDDADLDAFLSDVRWGIYFNAGQVCSAMSRVIVQERVHDRLVDGIAAMAEGLEVGNGLSFPNFGPNMGAMISEDQCQRASAMITQAEREGARLATGGRRMNRPGYFLEPTVLAEVTPEMTIAQNEVFGPALSVLKFKDEDEAIRIANSTPYGLVAGVFTTDLDRAMHASKQLRAGQIFVNEWYAGGVETPFGGFGKSGYGREKGREALLNYVQTKNVAIKLR